MLMTRTAAYKLIRGRNKARYFAWSPLIRTISSRTDNNSNGSGGGNGPGPARPPVLKSGFQPTGINKDGVYMGSTFLMLSPHTLPELDVSSVLNSVSYTRRKDAPINGNEAALRLAKAKNELRDIIQQELECPLSRHRNNPERRTNSTPSTGNHNFGDVKKMYILRQHGVPNQLLQHLLTAADEWMENQSALELWIDSSCQSTVSVFTTEGSSWRNKWPIEWDGDIQLYLAVMKRMVSGLASMTAFCEYNTVLPGDLQYKVSISRHNKLPLTLFPNDPEIFPVVEWVVPDEALSPGSRKIGKIAIRLQGSANPDRTPRGNDCLKQSHDVSMIFEASFDTNNDGKFQHEGT